MPAEDRFAPDETMWLPSMRGQASRRFDVRRMHDPLVERMLELRAGKASGARRAYDKLKYGPRAQVVRRLREKLAAQTLPAWEIDRAAAAVAEFDNQLEALYAQLPRPKTKGHGG